MGIEIKTSIKIGRDISLSQLKEENNAILITTASKDTNKLDTPGIELKGVIDGYQFLEDVFRDGIDNYLRKTPQKYHLGIDVIVVGGGDTALDCARTALRLTQGNIMIAYRRAEYDMPADLIMLQEAKEEGIEFVFLAEPKAYQGHDGSVTSIIMNRMLLRAPDHSGRRSPEPISNQEFKMECSSVLLAVGRGPDSFIQTKAGIKTSKHKSIAVDNQYKTSMKGSLLQVT